MIGSMISGMGSSLAALRVVKDKLEVYKARFTKQPEIQREIAYFKENIGKVKTPDDLTSDYRLLKFTLGAFNLEEQTFAKAFVKKILTEGADQDTDLANKMVDKRFREMTAAFDFPGGGVKNLADPKWVAAIADRWVTNKFEESLAEGNPAVRNALYFERKVGNVKHWYEILGDSSLNEVVRTTLGLPIQFAKVDLEKQAKLLEERIGIATFKDPAKVKKLLNTYLAKSDISNPPSGMSSAIPQLQMLQPLTGFRPLVTIDPTLLLKR